MLQEREQWLKNSLGSANSLLSSTTILDLGCGAGHNLSKFEEMGVSSKNLFGVDLIEERIAKGRALRPNLNLSVGDGTSLQFADASFDIVIVFTVFSSVLDLNIARRIASEMARVLKPGGVIVWYDMRINNPYNSNIIGYCCKKVAELFPQFKIKLDSITMLPPPARRLGRFTPALYPLLTRFSVLHSHYIGLLTKQ